MNTKIAPAMIDQLIDKAFESGYYQATLEKCTARLSDEELKEYARLNDEAIRLRNQFRDFIKSRLEASTAAATLGSMTSERKAASSRENGKLGGRPRKQTTDKGDETMENTYVYGWYHYANGTDIEFRYPAEREDDLRQDGKRVTVDTHRVGSIWDQRKGIVVWGGGNYTVIPA